MQALDQKTTVQKTTVGDKVNEFVQKHRKPIYITGGAIVLLLVAGIVTISFMDYLHGKAISAVEELNTRYTDRSESTDIPQLLADLEAFARKNSGYAGGKAWSIIGSIYSERQDWADAEAAWAAAAKASGKTYLAPLALFNAGASAEEQGKFADAINYYTESLASTAVFPAAARAQFAIGRLQETLNEDTAAIEAYRSVISGWPYDLAWVNLARSRIIALEAK